MDTLEATIRDLLGLGVAPIDLHFGQMLARALLVCLSMLAALRLAGRRFLAQKNPFDVMLAFIMASMMSRVINGSGALWATLGTGLMMGVAYRLVAWWMCRAHWLGRWLKGRPDLLVQHGQLQYRALNRHQISEHDLAEDMRLNAAIDDFKKIKAAWIERNGDISIQREPQVIEIKVEPGVQKIHLLIE